ncbi:MAG: FHA domain-containing protein [Hyphomicrobiaceae bacterium]
MLGTILSVISGINTVIDAYKNVGVLVNGDGTDRILDAIRETRQELVQLRENIYFAPQWRAVSDTEHPSRALGNLRSVCQVLEPVQQAIGGKIVSSRVITTPDKMEKVLRANPWDVLQVIRPYEFAAQHPDPAMVPIMFVHDGGRYVGWQMRGVLPVMFDCEWHDVDVNNIRGAQVRAGDALRFGTAAIPAARASAPTNHGWILSGFDTAGRALQFELRLSAKSGRPAAATWTVGRDRNRAQFLIDDDSVSGAHAQIVYDEQQGLTLRDLGSINGTRLNGAELDDRVVPLGETGQEITFGAAKVRLSRLIQ